METFLYWHIVKSFPVDKAGFACIDVQVMFDAKNLDATNLDRTNLSHAEQLK